MSIAWQTRPVISAAMMLVLDPQKGTASQAETSRESAPYTMTERSIEVRSEVERGEVGIGAPFYRREKLSGAAPAHRLFAIAADNSL